MKITDIRATTVAVPLRAPLRHANGAHWGRFVRTIVEVETEEGLIGLGEMGGGGESAEAAFRGLKSYLVGHDPFELEALRFKICNPTSSLYNNLGRCGKSRLRQRSCLVCPSRNVCSRWGVCRGVSGFCSQVCVARSSGAGCARCGRGALRACAGRFPRFVSV